MKLRLTFEEDSIFKRIAISLVIVMLIQTAFVYGVVFFGGTIEKLYNNSFDFLNEKVRNRKDNIESIMIKEWSNIDGTALIIKEKIEKSVKSYAINSTQLKNDSKLYNELFSSITNDLVNMTRENHTTGAFLILADGSEKYPTKGERFYNPGVYIRDFDPRYNPEDKKDLLLEKGPSSISKQLGITMDTQWESKISFNGDLPKNQHDYFYKPLMAGKKLKSNNVLDLGYWSPNFSLENDSMNIITYSVPIVGNDGNVYGVLGIEITNEYLRKLLPFEELNENRHASYLLALKNTDNSIKDIISSGELFNKTFNDKETISLKEEVYKNSYLFVNDNMKDDIYGSASELNLYNKNTPFENDKWVLIGMTNGDYLFKGAIDLKKHIAISILLSTIVECICIYIFTKRIVKPITNLSEKVRKSSGNKYLKLDKIGIREVDELSVAINELRQRVIENSSKLSEITSMADYYISAFEYEYGKNQVFVTNNFLDILQDDYYIVKENYIDLEVLKKIFKTLEDSLEEVSDNENVRVYKIKDKSNNTRWIKVNMSYRENSTLGVISDITREYRNKKKIEYERDYDLLTNLLNRRAFDTLVSKIFKEKDKFTIAAMIMIDLDNLKYVNDTYGHDFGDKYICLAGDMLKELPFSNTILSRISGDEFYIFIYGNNEAEIRNQIEIIKEKISVSKMNLPDKKVIRLRLSAGIAWYPKHSKDYETLMKYADFAMYMVKHTNKGQFADFNHKVYEKQSYIVTGKEELNRIIDGRLVQYKFQPIVSTSTGKVYAYEALMRPESDTIQSPMELLEIAKSQSKLYELESITFFNSLEQYSKHRKSKDYKLFVNSISNQILSKEDIVIFEEMFKSYLKNIIVEITEEEKSDDDIGKLKEETIKKWGTEFALDDFGSGYNGEATLLEICPKYIKVDKAITYNIENDINRQYIFENIVSYAKKRDIYIIAEGIENKEQMEKVILCGADYLQGYYLGMPDYELKDIDEKVQSEILEINKKI